MEIQKMKTNRCTVPLWGIAGMGGILPAIFLAVSAMAQTPVQIRGELQKETIGTVRLFKVENGNMVEMASSAPADGGRFGFVFYPENEGFYAIGTGGAGSEADNHTCYFKGGDRLDIAIDEAGYRLVGTSNSPENTAMHAWQALIAPLRHKAFHWMKPPFSTFVDFFPDLERIATEAEGFADRHKTGNKKFDRLFSSFTKWSLASCAAQFLNTPRSAHPDPEELSAYYGALDIADFSRSAAEVYRMPWGNRTLETLYQTVRTRDNVPYSGSIADLDAQIQALANDTLRGDAVLEYAGGQADFAAYRQAMDKYGQYVLTDAQKRRNRAKQAEMAQLKPGDAGLAFAYPDKDGRTVRFEDMRGKVVLVDVWATWCAPCREQFPHLKQLERDMEGRDVAIVSISTDADKDREKWQKMIKDEGLGGIQLRAGQANDFSDYYKIHAIPRFLVFDQQGRIVTVDAPRPSDPALKELLLSIGN